MTEETFGLTPFLQDHVNAAAGNGHPVVVGTIKDGRPRLSFYGTTQALSTTEMAIWVRPREGGLVERIPESPDVAFVYWNADERVLLHANGRARVATDEATRTRVFENAIEGEQRLDPQRLGTAVVVDLDAIEGFAEGQRFKQTRLL